MRFYILLVIFLSMAGCLRLKYPTRNAYLFHVDYPKKIQKTHTRRMLFVQNATIVPQFSGRSFVYRKDYLKYESDYYHLFFVPPAQQITQVITEWLQATDRFSIVTNNSLLTANDILQTQILELYVDNRNSSNPMSVMKIKFTLYKQSNYDKRMVFSKTYRMETPIMNRNENAVMDAWTVSLRTILTALSKQLP